MRSDGWCRSVERAVEGVGTMSVVERLHKRASQSRLQNLTACGRRRAPPSPPPDVVHARRAVGGRGENRLLKLWALQAGHRAS